MGAKLLYRDAQGRDAAADLPEVGAFLGRATECVVRTDDAMVSRRNCKISVQAGRWYVEDLGSANGTYVTTGSAQERRIQREGLTHGDVIRCGSLQVRFVEVADVPAVVNKPTVPTPPPPSPATSQPPVPPKTGPQPQADQEATKGPSSPAVEKADLPEKPNVSGVRRSAADETLRFQEELKKVVGELEEATGALKEAQEQRDQAVSKLESMETEIKRLRNEVSSTKENLEKLSRQAKKDKDELSAENRVNEELRQDLRQLRDQHTKVLGQLDEIKNAAENNQRQVASSGEDVRRAKKEVEALNAQLVKLARERDDQIRNMNSQRGDVDHLRDILKEREKIIEEQRVGIVNQEAQIKDLRRRAEDQERELADVKGKYENLTERYKRGQTQIEELHQLLTGQQQGGGEQLLHLTQENKSLRQDTQEMQDELNAQSDQLRKLQSELSETAKQRDKAQQDQKAAEAASQQAAQAAEQAAAQAAEKASAELKGQYEAELKKIADERDALVRERDDLKVAAEESSSSSGQQSAELASLTQERDRLTQERDQLAKERDQAAKEREQAAKERDGLKASLAEAEEKLKSAAAAPPPAAAPGGDAAAAVAQLADLKAVATSAYDGISDAFGSLRKNLVDLEEVFNKIERAVPDKDSAKRLRQSLEEVQNCFDDARSQIRSLRTVIE